MRVTAIRRRYHWHPAGLLFLGMTVLVGAAAARRGDNLLIFVFTTLLAWIVVSWLISAAMLMAVEVTRMSPARLRVGEAGLLRYRVRARVRFVPLFALSLEEVLGIGAATQKPARVTHCGGGEVVVASSKFTPERRQRLTLGRFRCVTAFPFGVVRKSLEIVQDDSILVHPRIEPLDHAAFLGLAGIDGPLARRRTAGSTGEELHGLREFRSGDSMRMVAWKRSASSEGLLVIERASVAARRLHLRVELLRDGPHADERAEAALSFAASVLAHAEAHAWAYSLELADADAGGTPMRSGRSHLTRCLDELALAEVPTDSSDSTRTRWRAWGAPRVALVITNRDGVAHSGTLGPEAFGRLTLADGQP